MRYAAIVGYTLLITVLVVAQSDICLEFMEAALEEVGQVCDSLERNQICYGNDLVHASFADSAVIRFAQPSDIVPVQSLDAVTTDALDLDNDVWGIAVMEVQASSIPNTIPGQALTFVLMGDVTLQNSVSADEAFIASEPLPVTVMTGANVRLFPDANSHILLSVAEGAVLDADAKTVASDWYRVAVREHVGWVSALVLNPTAGMETLPVFDGTSRAPMQAFYFSSGIGTSNCEELPNLLLIQGPQGIETELTINGAEVRIGSTIALRSLESGAIRLSVLDGYAIVNQITVPAGFLLDSPPVTNNAIPHRGWSGFRAFSEEEVNFYKRISQAVGTGSLAYVPNVPTIDDIEQAQIFIVPSATPTPTLEPATPLAGDNSFVTTNAESTPSSTSTPIIIIDYDYDGDGVFGDELSLGTDPYNPDTDGDGMWDGCDPNPTSFDIGATPCQ